MAKFATYANNINWWLWHFSTTYTSLTIVLNHNTVYSLHLSKKCLKGHSSIKTELKSCLVLITKFPDCLPSFLENYSKWLLFLGCPFLLLRRLGVNETTSQLQKVGFSRLCEVSWEVIKLGWEVSKRGLQRFSQIYLRVLSPSRRIKHWQWIIKLSLSSRWTRTILLAGSWFVSCPQFCFIS